jgi:hypothetical protein
MRIQFGVAMRMITDNGRAPKTQGTELFSQPSAKPALTLRHEANNSVNPVILLIRFSQRGLIILPKNPKSLRVRLSPHPSRRALSK